MNKIYRILIFVLMSVTCTIAVLFVATFVPDQIRTVAPPAANSISTSKVDAPYVVNLASRKIPIDMASIERLPSFEGYRLYSSRHMVDGATWYRLRLGYFPDVASARRMAEALGKTYPGAWISRATGNGRVERGGAVLASSSRPSGDSPGSVDASALPRLERKVRADSAPVTVRVAHEPGASAIRAASPSVDRPLRAPAGGGDLLANARVANPSECDELAAHPWDPDRIAEGRYWNRIPAARAVEACEIAIRGDASARNMFQYARALAKAKRFVEAAQWYKKSADQGYAQAQYAFGDIFEFGEGVETDYREAQRWYLRAAQQGYSHAEKRLVRLREAGLVPEEQYVASIEEEVGATER